MHSSSYQPAPNEGAGYGKAITLLFIAAVIGLAVAIGHVLTVPDAAARFMHAYAVGFAFILSLGIGALFFLLINHLSNSGWPILIRRVVESMALNLILVAVLFLPIAGSILMNDGSLFIWAQPDDQLLMHPYNPYHEGMTQAQNQETNAEVAHTEIAQGATEQSPASTEAKGEATGHDTSARRISRTVMAEQGIAKVHTGPEEAGPEHDHVIVGKRGYLNAPFFLARWVFYFVFWGFLGWYYWSQSVKQDTTGDHKITMRLHHIAGPSMLLFGLTLTLAAFDLIMSIEAHFYSTIFGVYYFGGCMVGFFAFMILFLNYLQKAGRLSDNVNTEHYHDLGKYLFGFIFFWTYIAFSQYILIWYASLPEEVFWYHVRGASTQNFGANAWSWVILLLLFGHFAIPFAGLMSRHVKRSRSLLICWAVWMLIMHWVDLVWLIMPAMGTTLHIGLAEIGLSVALLSIFLIGVLYILGRHSIVPLKDPRLHESLAFENA